MIYKITTFGKIKCTENITTASSLNISMLILEKYLTSHSCHFVKGYFFLQGLQGLMKFQWWLFKILRKQNVTDRQTHNVKTVYPPQTHFAGGIISRQLFQVEKNIGMISVKLGLELSGRMIKRSLVWASTEALYFGLEQDSLSSLLSTASTQDYVQTWLKNCWLSCKASALTKSWFRFNPLPHRDAF